MRLTAATLRAESGKLVADIMAKRFEDPEEFKREVDEANAMKGERATFQIGQVVPIQEAVQDRRALVPGGLDALHLQVPCAGATRSATRTSTRAPGSGSGC